MNDSLKALSAFIKTEILDKLKSKYAEQATEALLSQEAQDSMRKILQELHGTRPPAKKKKDPYAPKRNLSAYLLFCKDQRSNVKTNNPSWNAKDVVRELGRLWRDLDKGTKDKFSKLAAEDKQRYLSELETYKLKKENCDSSGTDSDSTSSALKKHRKTKSGSGTDSNSTSSTLKKHRKTKSGSGTDSN